MSQNPHEKIRCNLPIANSSIFLIWKRSIANFGRSSIQKLRVNFPLFLILLPVRLNLVIYLLHGKGPF